MDTEKYLSSLGNNLKSGKKSNVFLPLTIFTGIVISACVFAGLKTDPPLNYYLFGFAGFCVLLTMVMYVIIFFKDPQLLQSETFRLEDKKLDIMIQKGGGIDFNPVNLTPIQYEDIKKLENDSEGNG